MELKGKVINFLGDSITEGRKVVDPNNRYFERIKAKYGLAAANGYGISGTRFADQKVPSIFPTDDIYFASRIDDMCDADAVVVFGGTNDFGHGDAAIGEFSDRTPETFYGACHDLFTRLIEKYPGKPIVIMTPLHRTNEDEVRVKHGVSVTLKTYVDIIREVAEYYSLPVCDMYKNSGLQPRVPIIQERFIKDGLHPNDDGHAIIAERLGAFLENL
ncbi:MAG: SGNH/GDSL hydrolase family protein [Ruminococcaceae bacterium]|nr:SGNH/GDSL hydrolase family protein [Oscillospiraceae bacterium]